MIDYAVEMKQSQDESNDDDYIQVAENITDTSYNYTTSIVPGSTYQFKVKARNMIGFS